jgi:[ribosomal protein S5]-alanine N-acetyltransferase
MATMETLRTMLMPLAEGDQDDILALRRDERVRRHLGGPVSQEESVTKFNDMLHARPPESYWAARQKDDGAFIGLASISLYHDQLHYEVSYELHPTFWGQGYGTEIVGAVVAYGFEALGLEELYAETQATNLASVKLLEKVGMRFVSRIERYGEEQVVYVIHRRSMST